MRRRIAPGIGGPSSSFRGIQSRASKFGVVPPRGLELSQPAYAVMGFWQRAPKHTIALAAARNVFQYENSVSCGCVYIAIIGIGYLEVAMGWHLLIEPDLTPALLQPVGEGT